MLKISGFRSGAAVCQRFEKTEPENR